ncbi:MAG TPA: hypothetical protein VKX16_15320 [Chloroflexota bacterium]|nr:hypothetical protein [Chloroflexota bacterium]
MSVSPLLSAPSRADAVWRQIVAPSLGEHVPGETRTEIEAAVKARIEPDLTDILRALYPGHRFLDQNGRTFPVIELGSGDSIPASPDAILGEGDFAASILADPELRERGRPYLRLLESIGAYVYDAPTYAVQTLHLPECGMPRIDCRLGSYFDMLLTCDALEWELLGAVRRWPEYGGDVRSFLERELPARHRAHRLATGDPIVHTIGRSAALAVSTLILCRREEEWVILFGDRSERGVATHGDVFHVLPSFMLQPVTGRPDAEFVVTHHIYRELLEELCGLPDTHDTGLPVEYFYDHPSLRYLRRLLDSGEARLTLCGLVVDPLKLRPEICVLLCIDAAAWVADHAAGRDGLTVIAFEESYTPGRGSGQSVCLPLADIETHGIDPARWVPPGAAAVLLGIRAARRLGWV